MVQEKELQEGYKSKDLDSGCVTLTMCLSLSGKQGVAEAISLRKGTSSPGSELQFI